MVLSELGQRVAEEWMGIPKYYPQVEIIALQMMPDHLHGIILALQTWLSRANFWVGSLFLCIFASASL